jgi:hypothetical protein
MINHQTLTEEEIKELEVYFESFISGTPGVSHIDFIDRIKRAIPRLIEALTAAKKENEHLREIVKLSSVIDYQCPCAEHTEQRKKLYQFQDEIAGKRTSTQEICQCNEVHPGIDHFTRTALKDNQTKGE